MGAVKDALDVDCQQEIPKLLIGMDEEGEAVGAGVIDQDVDRTVARGNLIKGFVNGGKIGDVKLNRFAADLAGKLARGIDLQVGNDHGRPLGRQPARGRRAYSACPSGHNRDLLFKSH